ncbi:MAG: hypothetical protein CL804_03430 [Citromicrobium sp.]|nr:hypothetical protein [Citromicrobium sp.]|tara:strand:+ start:1416 stop:1922 length:507 start_codon:yes stop_codon:yes gene_type:complete
MCGPPALALIGAAVSVVGTGVSALQGSAQAQYEAKIAERNQDLANEAARREIEATQTERQAHYRRVAALKGQQRVTAAANGVSVDFGTAANVLADTEMLSREDVRRINQRGNDRVRAYDIESSNFGGEANAARSAGTGALVGGAFSMASQGLGGFSQYQDLRSRRAGG